MPSPSQSITPSQSSQASHSHGRKQNSGTDDPGSIFSLLAADESHVATANIEKVEKTTPETPVTPESDQQATAIIPSSIVPAETELAPVAPTEIVIPDSETAVTPRPDVARSDAPGQIVAAPVLDVIQTMKTGQTDSSSKLGELVRNAAQSIHADRPAQPGTTSNPLINNSNTPVQQPLQPGAAIPSADLLNAEGPMLNNPGSGKENLLLNEQIRQALSQATEGTKFNADAALSGQIEHDTESALINQLSAARQITVRTDAATGLAKIDLPGNIQQPAWQQALAERVVFAANKNIQQVELQLHPAELGQVSIRIESNQDRAAIQMTAMHADTREALDAALPRLREMFTQQGMDLVHADVQQQTSQQQDNSADGESLMPSNEEINTEETHLPLTTAAGRPTSPDSLLDLYI